MKKLTIIGGGPAALMLAAQINTNKYEVTICEKKKAAGRKFLVAGEGGLNLTFNSSIDELLSLYSPKEFMDLIIRQFTNEDLIEWLKNINVPTFIGSSNRVFPEQDLKPIEVLNKIVERLAANNVSILYNKKWTGWSKEGNLLFEEGEEIDSDLVVFALGGASWKVTGSNGEWSELFKKRKIKINPFRAANCAFEVEWSKNLITTHAGKPLKNIALSMGNYFSKGELVISKFGLEGNAIYALSEKIQEFLITGRKPTIHLDLKPSLSISQIQEKFNKSKLSKMTDILQNDLNMDRTSIAVLKQFSDKDTFTNPKLLAVVIKSIPISIVSADDLDKAISTLGGISLDEVNENMELKKAPHSYVIGEMLDWYAPTGGYLLQGCFSMGFVLAKHLNNIE